MTKNFFKIVFKIFCYGYVNIKAKRRAPLVMDWWEDETYQPGISVFQGITLDPVDVTKDRIPMAKKSTPIQQVSVIH